MEVVGALASSLQIVSQCGQVTMTVIRWIESVRTVDERIDAFIHEVSTLRMTYEGLNRSLKDPSILEAARITNRDVGGHLWTQMSKTLHDCEATMNNIAGILGKIQSSSNLFRPVLKQLKESLHTGELARLRDQIVMFNSSLQLPMQMITLTLQLRQQETTTAHQVHLNEQLVLLGKGIERIERITKSLSQPRRSQTMSSATMVDESSSQAWVENMEKYVDTAKKFLDGASVAASTLSARSTGRYDADSPVDNLVRRPSTFVPLTQQKIKAINTYVDDVVQADSGAGSGTPLPSDAPSDIEITQGAVFESDEDDDDDDLQMLQVLLQNGHSKIANRNYSAAEENYREALSVSESHNFGSQVACSATDIALMLGECLVKQEKYDETIDLLQPLAGPPSANIDTTGSTALSTISSSQLGTDKGQMLAANHLLGKVYLMKADYTNAEKCSIQAMKGRKKLLGDSHAKTVESVHLVIDMYKATGREARAEATREVYLKPAIPSPPPTEPILMPPTSSPARQRRPTFNFTSPFKRTDRVEKTETTSAAMPVKRNSNVNHSPFLVADEFNHLSTSPNDTSSLHMGSEIRPIERQVRTHSTNSLGSNPNLQRWPTTSDSDAQQIAHQRTSIALTKPPTLYAVLSPSDLEQRFLEVSTLANNGKEGKAVDRGITILQQYDPDSTILLHRRAELKENIRRGKDKGLAGTGHGFSPLHLFCSMKYEPLTEIEILLRLGADPGAVAYKAGYGKVDPFVPVTLAIERGHENIVKLLLQHGIIWQPDVIRVGSRFNADRDLMHPLLQACQKGRTSIVKVLLEHKTELTEDLFPRSSWHGNSLLHEACYRCDLDVVSVLLNFARHNGTLYEGSYSFIGTPSQQDEFGMTAIMYAVDMREYDEKLRVYKLQNRVACLRLLLGLNNSEGNRKPNSSEESTNGLPRQSSPDKLGTGLHLLDKRGNTVYWYTDESKAEDSEVIAFLDEQSRKSRLIEL